MSSLVDPGDSQLTTLGGGCFWCLEAVLKRVEGVVSVQAGYSGGDSKTATYEKVSTGKTGHAEVVQLTFNEDVISFREILEIFFKIHDPTTRNRQGNDIGPQYRSVIFYHDPEQMAVAREIVEELNGPDGFNGRVVTEIRPFRAFYKAERYHEDYYERNAGQAYCRLGISPKISKLQDNFGEKLREES